MFVFVCRYICLTFEIGGIFGMFGLNDVFHVIRKVKDLDVFKIID